jgi:multiple sugar transport system substrate-binding protein
VIGWTKPVSMILVTALMMVSFIGCSSSSTSSAVSGNSGGSGDSKKKVELEWLVRSDPGTNPWEELVAKEYEKRNPNTKVKLTIVPNDQLDQKLSTRIASGDTPDVIFANWAVGGFGTYWKQLLDITPYIELEPDVLKGFNEKILDIYKRDGRQYGLPVLSLGSFLFYNKDLYDEAGLPYPTTDWNDTSWTWDKMVANAKKLTKSAGDQQKRVYGVVDGLWPANADAWMFGGDYFSKESYETSILGEPTVNDPAVRQGIQAHYDLIHTYKVSPSSAEMKAVSALGDPFLTGKVAMVMTGGWGFWSYKPAKFRWGVAALPYVEGRRPVLFNDQINIMKGTKHPHEAWGLIKLVADPEFGLKKYVEMTHISPPHDGLLEGWYSQISKALDQPAEQIKQVNEGALNNGSESANHLLFSYTSIENVMNQALGAVYDGSKDIDAALKEIEAGLKALNLKEKQ